MRRSHSFLGVALFLAGCSSPSTPPAEAPAATTPAATAPAATAPAPETTPSALAPAAPAAPAGVRATVPAAPSTAPPAPASAPAAPAAPAASSTPAAPPAPAAPPPPVYREVTVPSGTTLSIELKTAVASNTSAVEDDVRGVLRRAVLVDGHEVLAAGTPVRGNVTEAERSGRVKGRARLAIRFTSITIGDESLRMSSNTIAREAAGTKGEDAKKIGIGAGAGAVIGAIVGGKKGAAVGGAVGAGAGTGTVLATRGDEVSLAAGTAVSTTLTQPLVFRVREE